MPEVRAKVAINTSKYKIIDNNGESIMAETDFPNVGNNINSNEIVNYTNIVEIEDNLISAYLQI